MRFDLAHLAPACQGLQSLTLIPSLEVVLRLLDRAVLLFLIREDPDGYLLLIPLHGFVL